MILNEKEKSGLKNLLDNPYWQVVIRIGDDLKDRIQKGSTMKDGEWETLKATVEKEGRIKGICELFQEIFKKLE